MSIQTIGGGSVDSFYRNRKWTIPLEIWDGAGPVDLTGADVTFVLAAQDSTTPLLTKDNALEGGLFVLDAANGRVVVTATDAETDFDGTYAYELVVDLAGKLTYGSGHILIRPSIDIS
jgi:hypothetical protein